MGIYIKNWSIADWKELLKWAKIGANNAMIGEFAEVEEIPPHGDLIDRDALRSSIKESIDECWKWADEVDKDTMMYARISQSVGTFVECSLRAKAAPAIIPASFENPAKSRDNHEIDDAEEDMA